MMQRIMAVTAVFVTAVAGMAAQDPLVTLPEAYKLQFENDVVKVVRVEYAAGAKLPDHTHPAGTTVYVYLNDSEGVIFAHSGNINRSVTRPPVKTGAVRVSSGPEEHHTAENPSKEPSRFLRIWFKGDTSGARNVRARLSPTDNEFSNKQMRITRLKGGETVDAKDTPALIVKLASGDIEWVERGQRVTLDGSGLRIDVLTPR
jgi:hypothetical protein